MKSSALIIFVKYPEPGRVKTRLGATIGQDFATDIYRMLVEHIINTVGYDSTTDVYVYINDPARLPEFREWLGNTLEYRIQKGHTLGERMQTAFLDMFNHNYNDVMLIGSDVPELTPGLIRKAYHSFDKHDIILGPASDGGYYLIGFRSDTFLPDLFNNMAWGTCDVLNKTLEYINRSEYNVYLMPTLSDIDTYEDLQTYLHKPDSIFPKQPDLQSQLTNLDLRGK